MSITSKHFFGSLQVKQAALPPRVGGAAALDTSTGQEELEEYIAEYEDKFIRQFLGQDILTKLKDLDAQYDTLRAKVFGTGDKPISFLAYFIYYEMLDNELSHTTERGGKTDDKAYLHTKKRSVKAWNVGVELYKVCIVDLALLGYDLGNLDLDEPTKIQNYE